MINANSFLTKKYTNALVKTERNRNENTVIDIHEFKFGTEISFGKIKNLFKNFSLISEIMGQKNIGH